MRPDNPFFPILFMMTGDISFLFGATGLLYGLAMPVAIALILAVILIPSLQRPGAHVRSVGDAVYCYLMLGVGVLLMTMGALPTVHSVLVGAAYAGETYIALLFIFAVGGALFLWHDNLIRTIDGASKSVPAALYFSLLKIVGRVITLLAALSLSLTIILRGTDLPGWWVTPLIMLLYGLLLSWCTASGTKTGSFFLSMPMSTAAPKAVASVSPKASAKKSRR